MLRSRIGGAAMQPIKPLVSEETHMQVFARLSSVKNMYGKPGPKKGKSA